VDGEDDTPRRMTDAEIREQLGDPFATLLLLQGIFPATPAQVLDALDEATQNDDRLRKQMSFILGEGSQVAVRPETASLPRNLRFVISRGSDPDNGPDVLVSASDPEQTRAIELMAWDRTRGGFNFYTTAGDEASWIFAGGSRVPASSSIKRARRSRFAHAANLLRWPRRGLRVAICIIFKYRLAPGAV
jgi:hypothetical protein